MIGNNVSTWPYINIEVEKQKLPNKFTSSKVQQDHVRKLSNRRGNSLGGYMEDRTNIWDGVVEDLDNKIHCGIDVTVKESTPIFAPCCCSVVYRYLDTSKTDGWGFYMIMKPLRGGESVELSAHERTYILIGHLKNSSVELGQKFKKGEIIGYVGNCEENGGWFEHVHIQCITEDYYMFCKNKGIVSEIDGYVETSNEVKKHFPNPANIMM
jgi:murein DD-endopeptidase MepM/ murein hydrolase activator NlpD